MTDEDVHDPQECEHEQCGHAYEAGYIAGKMAVVEQLRSLASEIEFLATP